MRNRKRQIAEDKERFKWQLHQTVFAREIFELRTAKEGALFEGKASEATVG
jgi:hypothetical protein